MSSIKKIIRYFFHHQFSGEMVDRVHQRLAEPGDEREKEEALREIWNEIGFPEADKRSEMAFARLEDTLGGRPRQRLRIPAWVRIAAIWLVPLLSLGVSYYLYRDVEELTFIERFVPSGKRERVTLPDGSEVWLNSGTLLLYPSEFVGQTREIYLVGEGYFKVWKHPEQPFIVRTKAMRVQVLGTEFNISAYPDQEKITTTLEEGSLKILPDDSSVTPYLLKPNEQLVYIPSLGKVDVQQVVASDYSDWKEGGLLFNNDSFEDILKTLERVYNVKVHLRTSAYHSNRLTIHFNKNESLENIMMLVKEMIPGLEYQIKENRIYID
ncbi:FecR family protein [uncultured Parabacteroides sp.]|uniref:FecR family protein n=1 Tax=uncultured Parabacteroides sp. TaxID=512312 RepID=UPI00262DE9EC|nr:FecR family protein [uncultured Parabacteroides sp.]